MNFIGDIMQGVGKVIEQWVSAGSEKREEIEARAREAIAAMLAGAMSADADHEDRTKETEAAIEAAKQIG